MTTIEERVSALESRVSGIEIRLAAPERILVERCAGIGKAAVRGCVVVAKTTTTLVKAAYAGLKDVFVKKTPAPEQPAAEQPAASA